MSKGVSILCERITVKGDIISDDCIDVSSKIYGKVISNILSVKENGNINGDIYANEVVLTNKSVINGNVFAKKVKMLKGASVNGTITYSVLSMEDGAKIIGDVKYLDENSVNKLVLQSKGSASNEAKNK